MRLRGAPFAALAALAFLAVGSTARARPAPHVKHVFIIVLENENAATTFGKNTKAPYLARRLRRKGAFVPNYYGIGHDSNDNYLAMISGQGPNPQTQSDCQDYTEFQGNTFDSDGQLLSTMPFAGGCVYPPGVATVANLLEDSGFTWKGYMQGMNKASDRPGEPGPCRHPEIGKSDNTLSSPDGYVTKHNPFVYFHSIIDFPTCRRNVVGYSRLHRNLRHRGTTPNYSFIVPDMCNDGHNEPCKDGRPGGLVTANKWLRRNVPRILRSPAFKRRGLLMVLFDEATSFEDDPDNFDSSACCGEKQSPNTPNNGGLGPGPGGGRTGAVFVSPCIRPRTVTRRRYNHYSTLRSIERNFGLRPFLGYAGQEGLRPFGRDVFTHPSCEPSRRHRHAR